MLYKGKKPKRYPRVELWVSDNGYIFFYDHKARPCIVWVLYDGGWEAFKKEEDGITIFSTYNVTIPTEKDIEIARKEAVK